MKKLNVIYSKAKGDTLPVGQLATSGHKLYFEYAPSFLVDPLWLSPFKLPPKPGLFEHKDLDFAPLFGLFDDSLPDGWGLMLMDRFFTSQGIDVAGVSILHRLAFLGNATMGALTYEPALPHEKESANVFDLQRLAEQSREIIEGRSDTVLPQLMRAGGSPGGARPKVLVGVDGEKIISGEDDLPEGFEHWIVKFNAGNDLPDAGAVEYAYSLMARDAGIVMPETRLFQTGSGESFFGIKRFDRQANRRYHVHTLGNMLHVNYRIPSMDYQAFFKVIKVLTKNHQDLLRGFRQMVFNVFANNRDDHVKNFAFMLDDSREWTLTPAYDLTYSPGPGGEHSMTVAGEGQQPRARDFIQLGQEAGLSRSEVNDCLDRVLLAVNRWTDHAQTAHVMETSKDKIEQSINRNIKGGKLNL
ncbi:type II toxin-antitoxin system HipA family toxin [Desulfocicer niacini]